MVAPVIKEMQVEITMRYHHTPMRLSKVFLKIMTSPNQMKVTDMLLVGMENGTAILEVS